MLTPLKTLEDKLAQLLTHVAQLRLDKTQLRAENLKLRTENQDLIERMRQAQQRVDHILHTLENQTVNDTREN